MTLKKTSAVVIILLFVSLLTLYVRQEISAADSTSPNLLGKNLIVNGDAESGAGSTGGNTPVSVIPGWTRTGNMDVVQYAHGDLRPSDPDPKILGNNYFAGGPDSPTSTISQTIDLSQIASNLDSGNVTYSLSGYLGGFTDQKDNSAVTIQFEDADGKKLSNGSIGPVTVDDRGKKTAILLRTASGKIPAGTRKVEVDLVITRADGAYNDGYADNLSLVLKM